jgi:hypothetical protein
MSVGRGAIMKWQRDRDLLIAQTMAFVQSVTGKPMSAEGRSTRATCAMRFTGGLQPSAVSSYFIATAMNIATR